jgi:hypothetical protein
MASHTQKLFRQGARINTRREIERTGLKIKFTPEQMKRFSQENAVYNVLRRCHGENDTRMYHQLFSMGNGELIKVAQDLDKGIKSRGLVGPGSYSYSHSSVLRAMAGGPTKMAEHVKRFWGNPRLEAALKGGDKELKTYYRRVYQNISSPFRDSVDFIVNNLNLDLNTRKKMLFFEATWDF